MIDFSMLKWLDIPDGRIKSFSDMNGLELWGIKLSNIEVTTPPAKTEYQEGEVFDPTGMIITAYYTNGETKIISNYTILNGDQIAENMTTINISYTEDGITVGTVYEVGFSQPVTITVVNSSMAYGTSQYGSVKHNGVTYKDNATFIANIGDVITVNAIAPKERTIYLNNISVGTQTDDDKKTYEYTVVSDATITLSSSGEMYNIKCTVRITDTNA